MTTTVVKSVTGRYHLKIDGRVVGISKHLPDDWREDYNRNQPRDGRGRWTSGGGGSRGGGRGGGGGLANKRVSELQEIAKKEGIDVDTLSHKRRKSVLTAAIKAKRKNKDLREEGLLKPVKPKGGLRGQAKSKTKFTKKPIKGEGLTGDNASVVRSKQEFFKLYDQWEKEVETQELATKISNLNIAVNNRKESIKEAKAAGDSHVTFFDNVKMDHAVLLENNRYHRKNKSLKIESKEGKTIYKSDFINQALATVSQREDGKYVSSASHLYRFGTIEAAFNTKAEANKHAKTSAEVYLATKVFPIKKVEAALNEQQSKDIGKLKQRLAEKKITDFSGENLDRIVDNKIIHRDVRDAIQYENAKALAIKDKSGNLQSAIAYDIIPSIGRKNQQETALYIEYLATAPWNAARSSDSRAARGAGARALAESIKQAKKEKADKVQLVALEGAKPFYNKMGMTYRGKEDDGYFEIAVDSSQAKTLIEKYG